MPRKGPARYEIIYVMRDGERRSLTVTGAPHPELMFRRRPKGNLARFALRFYPSKKAWRVYDLDKFIEHARSGRASMVILPGKFMEAPDLDAAIMAATLVAGS